ncbi:MAG TPA: hypothetical protein VK815_11915 [Candidatus Acidoferrales bacterium]|jgi:hypothetical protein|nr:hypothetical protein [Candidatus Acidoferrales bacterium]
MQIYAIYFQKTRVGRGSNPENSLKIIIALKKLMTIGVLKMADSPKYADLLGNLRFFEIKNLHLPFLLAAPNRHPQVPPVDPKLFNSLTR